MLDKPRIIVFHSAIGQRIAAGLGEDFDVAAPVPGEDKMAWLDRVGAGVRVAVFLTVDRINAALLDRLPDLAHIQIAGSGMNAVDLNEVARRNITIDNAARAQAGEIADYTVGLMIAARRGIVRASHWVHRDLWGKRGGPGLTRSVTGSKVGIVGLGNIGRAVARRLGGFDVELGWWGPRAKPDTAWKRHESLLELARWADILIVSVFAHDETRGLIDREVIDAVGSDGLIVNISRGFVVDEEAIIAALKEKRLGQAALDVFETEPTPGVRWSDVPNVTLSPHVAGGTFAGARAIMDHTLARLREVAA